MAPQTNPSASIHDALTVSESQTWADPLWPAYRLLNDREASLWALPRIPRPTGYRNECKALQQVHQYATVLIPKAIDIATLYGQDDTTDGMPYDAYILMSRLPGISLLDCHDVLSDGDLERIAARMRKYLVHIRTIPNLVNRDAPICNALVDEFTQRDGSKARALTGIVDWEFAGYYPENWNCTKAHYEGSKWLKRHNDMMKDIFKEFGDYSRV
ncbi:hypothetical protein GGR55DRAFT_675827 [Xylaria sp. FL0064]|nr:hypothetical protein GGR55DRAFT_675827 [Xylaria sp. FL0064]